MSGLTANGFDRKRLIDIKTDIETALKAALGENIDLTPQSVFGQIIGIISEIVSDQWESQENIYNSEYPSTAQGNQLSNVVTFNGLVRQPATNSTAIVTITGTAGTNIPLGSKVSVVDTGFIFVTLAAVVIGGGGTVDVAVESEETGPIEAAIGTLTVIETPIFGWTSVTNAAAATPGQNQETDAELRERRSASTVTGQNNSEALFSELSNLTGVIAVEIIDNTTDAVDAFGVPAHSFECIVQGGTEADIVESIWRNTPVGIISHGDTTVVIQDIQGNDQNVSYSRPQEIPIYFDITLTVDTDVFPVGGEDDIKAAIVAYGVENFSIGDDVIYTQFYTPINETPGILTITMLMDDTDPPVGTTNISIDRTRLSTYDIADIDITIP